VTAGEHSGRDYGRDDPDYPSYYGQTSGYDERHSAPPWGGEQAWGGQQDQSGQQDWPGQQPWPPAGGGTWYGDRADSSGERDPYRDHDPYQQGEILQPGAWHGSDATASWRGDHATASWRGDHATGAWQRPVIGPEVGGPDDGEDSRRGGRHGKGRRGLPLWQEVPLLLVIAFCLALLVRTFLLQAFYIPSGSMEETLLAGDRVLVNKVVYQVRDPARGEVVVFRGTEEWSPQHALDTDIGMFSRVGRAIGEVVGISRPTEKDYIKRIIGLPGDLVSCCDVEGRVFVNGQPLDEDYITFNAPLNDAPEGGHDCRTRRFDEIVVEPGQMFVLGDHRAISQDSRCQGQVPTDNIIGRAFVIVWPSARWTSLSAPDTFASVPQAADPTLTEQVTAAPGAMAPAAEAALVMPLLLSAAVAGRRCGVSDRPAPSRRRARSRRPARG
jgi:signal peptidase I